MNRIYLKLYFIISAACFTLLPSLEASNNKLFYDAVRAEASGDLVKAVDIYCDKVGLGNNVKISMSWFNVLEKGQSVNLHRHEVSVLSAAYYVKADKDSAGLNFKSPIDPYRMHEYFVKNTEYNVKNVEVACEQGTLYLFPSWLEHYTNPNQTDKRITISFNTMYV